MAKKPWPIIILSLLFVTEPLFKLFFYSWYWHRDISFLLATTTIKSSPYIFFMFFFAYPISGVAIYSVKKWSLPVFLTMEVMTLGGHFYNWFMTPQYFSMTLLCAMTILNIAVVSYFLIPAVRIAYLDPRVRWWAVHPRYVVDWKCTVQQDSLVEHAIIANIARGGVLLSFSETSSLRLERPFNIEFQFENFAFTLTGKIVYQKHVDDKVRYGVKFQALNRTQRANLRRCIRSLERQKFPRRPKRENPLKSFASWVYILSTTGKGLIPTVKKPEPESERKAS